VRAVTVSERLNAERAAPRVVRDGWRRGLLREVSERPEGDDGWSATEVHGCLTQADPAGLADVVLFKRRIGIEDKIQWFDGMTFIEPGGRQSPLQSVSLPAPLHAFPAFMSFKFLTLQDKIGLARALRSLLTHTAQDDGTTFAAWLQRRHQTSAAIAVERIDVGLRDHRAFAQ